MSSMPMNWLKISTCVEQKRQKRWSKMQRQMLPKDACERNGYGPNDHA